MRIRREAGAVTRVTRYAPDLPGWPRELALRVVVLSDFHACDPFMDAVKIGEICREANALAPDIVLLLGDYVSGPRFSRELDPADWANALATLCAPLGVHAVMGNHDYEGCSREAVIGGLAPPELALRAAGIAVYVNQSIYIAHGTGGFWLAGLGDQRAFHHRGMSYHRPDLGIDDLDGTLSQVNGDAPVLLMAHEPDIFPRVPHCVALTLSGHTHGGQVKLFGHTPVVPSIFGSRYVYGHVVEENRHLIVTSGLGYSGWPIRFATIPEIVLIELGGPS